MDERQLIARVLSEIATARAAIAASYLRLWRSRGPSTITPGDPGREALRPAEPGATQDQESSRDAD